MKTTDCKNKILHWLKWEVDDAWNFTLMPTDPRTVHADHTLLPEHYKPPLYPVQRGPHGLQGSSPLWPPLSGQQRQLLVSASSRNSAHCCSALGSRGWVSATLCQKRDTNIVPVKTFLLVMWLRVHLPMQRPWVWCLSRGTVIPHAKRQLSLHATVRESLHAPPKSPDIRKSPHITKETQLSYEKIVPVDWNINKNAQGESCGFSDLCIGFAED